MSRFAIETSLAVTSAAAQIALVNPAASGVIVEVTAVHCFGEQAQSIRVRRYGAEIVIETANPPAPAPTVYAVDELSASTEVTVVSKDSHAITPPSANDLDFEATIFDDATDIHIPLTESIAVPPGSSLLLETVNEFGGDGPTMRFRVEYQEVPAQPVAHIASAQLPAAGAFTADTYFDLPSEWTGLTFLLAYTAHGSSTNARPKWRVSWSDGTSDFIQPIVSSAVDATSLPVASRDQYQLTDKWPTGIAANATVHVAVPVARMPGMTKVRLDIAELGDTTNRGTATVTIVGG